MPFRIRKVVGSIPIRSTKMEIAAVKNCGDFSFDHRKSSVLITLRAPLFEGYPSLFIAAQDFRVILSPEHHRILGRYRNAAISFI